MYQFIGKGLSVSRVTCHFGVTSNVFSRRERQVGITPSTADWRSPENILQLAMEPTFPLAHSWRTENARTPFFSGSTGARLFGIGSR